MHYRYRAGRFDRDLRERARIATTEEGYCLGGNPRRYFFSPHMEGVVRSRIDICRRGGEFENVTVDYTAKPTIPLVGQTGHNKKKKERGRRQYLI